MASAILPSRNEPSSSDYMSKFTNNGNLNFTRLQNIPNPNPNPNPNRGHFFTGNTSRDVIRKNHQQFPSSAPPEAAFMGPSMNSVPANSYGHRYITFRLGSYTRRELKELKKRLISDLERVRVLRHWICSSSMPKKSYHPPQLEAPEVCLTGKERQKSAVGQKRTKPSPSVRDSKKLCGRVKNNAQRSKVVMRKCGQILGKLMKHKNGWVFNTPVDAAALKLYDYHSIINNPMDLGTIKSKLAKNEYESPLAFASDVRLTFQNAMVYNVKGSDVFVMAERLLLLFEDMFYPSHQKLVGNPGNKQNRSAKTPILVEKPVSNATALDPVAPQVAVLPGSTDAANLETQMGRDVKKPAMTAEEKSELAASLLNLQFGREGIDEMMGIIKKGVCGVEHEGDEIELDLGVLDNETLWELHSFIGGTRKKGAVATCNMKGMMANLVSSVQADNSVVEEQDIDIGEEIPVTNFPCVEIEKDAVNDGGSSCSSSSSGTDSSSSDSGTDSSSGE